MTVKRFGQGSQLLHNHIETILIQSSNNFIGLFGLSGYYGYYGYRNKFVNIYNEY